jgi:hypothetical protein
LAIITIELLFLEQKLHISGFQSIRLSLVIVSLSQLRQPLQAKEGTVKVLLLKDFSVLHDR